MEHDPVEEASKPEPEESAGENGKMPRVLGVLSQDRKTL